MPASAQSIAQQTAFKVAAICGLALVLLAASAAVGLYLIARDSQMAAIRSEVEQLAATAATLVDGDLHKKIRDPRQAGSTEHLTLLGPLVRFHKATRDVIYVYTAIEQSGGLFLVLGTDFLYRVPGDNLPIDPIMRPYPGTDPELKLAFAQKKALSNDSLHQGQFRRYLSAYAPFSSSTGFEGFVGVDMDAAQLEKRLASLTWGLVWVLSAILLVAVIMAFVLWHWHSRLSGQQRLRMDLEQARDLSEKGANVASLAAAVAHEFSQHLTVASGHVELALLDEKQSTGELVLARGALSLAAEAVEQMRTLAGSSWATLRSNRLSELINAAISRLSRRGLATKRVEHVVNPNFWVRADQLRIESAIGHLIRNALEAIDDQPVLIRVCEGEALASQGHWIGIFGHFEWQHMVAIVVSDHGPALNAGVEAQLGRAFFSSKGAGRGLGFAVIQSVSKEYSGALRYRRDADGHSFALLLPRLTLSSDAQNAQ